MTENTADFDPYLYLHTLYESRDYHERRAEEITVAIDNLEDELEEAERGDMTIAEQARQDVRDIIGG